MNVRELLQKVSSVGAAAAALFGASHAEATPQVSLDESFRNPSPTPPVEPLLLKPAPIKEEPLLLAGHSSHRSHSSHYSSSGGGGGSYAPVYPGTGTYTPPSAAPRTYTPPAYTPPRT